MICTKAITLNYYQFSSVEIRGDLNRFNRDLKLTVWKVICGRLPFKIMDQSTGLIAQI